MKIKLFSTGCPKCNVLKLKLNQLHLDYELIEDTDKVVDFGKEHSISTAPILAVDDNVYDFAAAVQFLKEVK